jgi:hypothetical protein
VKTIAESEKKTQRKTLTSLEKWHLILFVPTKAISVVLEEEDYPLDGIPSIFKKFYKLDAVALMIRA